MIRRFAASILLVAAAGAAFAEEDRPCRNDVMTYCGQHRGDHAAMSQCMRENMPKFSEACRARMQARMQAQQGQSGTGAAKPAPEAAEDTESSDQR